MLQLPELIELEDIILQAGNVLRVQQHGEVKRHEVSFPLYSISMGSTALDAPVLGFFGGVHGLERIGSQIVLAFLRSLLVRLRWDSGLQHTLKNMRLVFMPLINPIGIARGTRSNGYGVDLMRNAPIESAEKTSFLVGGHRISPHLPWYRGELNASMELENQALCNVVKSQLLNSPFSIALDCHSGFGLRDRLWFPYAHTRIPFPNLAEVYALKALFDQSYPHHPYVIEPQALQYCTHGDIWDYLYTENSGSGQFFLPLTLELGSWLWVKKNPRQLMSLLGLFNPIVPHRQQRVLRSHLLLFEFLLRAVHDHSKWLPKANHYINCKQEAEALWYGII
ncbi:M14 family zinc carboxypeptidase [Iodobacter sp. CM08]|uniref:M14 family zinc carboxypeptidase n=1 Tax=Iodobacter sp. CM08 TaxID=3085902 RepID=UPI002981300D|nr:M14 family zinc carboxypeptidase [Iodobacter sp. CM08]MDW5417696.1 M14 family zinc carboxypeptidase [Iodobacter sp. CM08]